jgi:hypothetical protein
MFTTTFCGNYIPPVLMAMKVGEFMRLTQGIRMMKEYLHAFNNLSRYAPKFVNTDAKKIASFKRGLNPKMLKTMGTSSRTMFNEFMSHPYFEGTNRMYKNHMCAPGNSRTHKLTNYYSIMTKFIT